MKISRIVAIGLALIFLVATARLARLENRVYRQFHKAVGQRPPAVVLIHGFSGDRRIMSTLARRLAENGYGVLAIDVNGHGENRNPFNGGEADRDALRENVKRAVDYLRNSDLVDGSRIVVMGHSMGAGAALDYATNDPNLKGAVMISGGWVLGPVRPKNALFIFAENDPDAPIQGTSIALATHLADVPKIELGKTYGDFAQGNAVEAVRVPGVNHVTIIASPEAATTIVKWLDSTFGTTSTGAIELKDPRRGAASPPLLLFVILLVPLGRVCGSMAPSWAEERPGPSGWMGLLGLAGARLGAGSVVSGRTRCRSCVGLASSSVGSVCVV